MGADLLRSVSLFAGLNAEVRAALVQQLKPLRLDRGSVLFREGDPGAALFLIQSGEVQVLSHEGTREICRLGPYEHVGEMSLIDQLPRSATVIAACDTSLWQLNAEDFDRLCQAHPEVHKQIAIALARRLRDTVIGTSKRPADAVVLVLDARHGRDGPDPVAQIAAAVSASTQRPVASVDLGIASAGRPKQTRPAIDDPESLGSQIDKLLTDHAHVLLAGDGAAAGDRLLRAAWGRADLAIVLLTSSPQSVELARVALDRLAGMSGPRSPAVELAIDRRGESPRRPFAVIDRLAAGRPVHTIAVAPGYRASGNPEYDGFGRLGRRIARRRVGLAMGGGGARAFAHVGVLDAFERAGVPVDVLAGTSGGAIVAGLSARDWPSSQIGQFLLARWTRRGVVDWGLFPWVSLLRGLKLERIGQDAGEGLTLEELSRPVVVVATDLVTGGAVHLRRGDGWTAVRASLSVPGIFPPVRVGDQYLVDGGAIDNLPADAARECGADIVIGVNVSPPLEPAFVHDRAASAHPNFFARLRDCRVRGLPLFRIIYRTITVQGQALQSRHGLPDLIISPDVSSYEMFEFRNLRPIIDIGRSAADASIDQVRQLL